MYSIATSVFLLPFAPASQAGSDDPPAALVRYGTEVVDGHFKVRTIDSAPEASRPILPESQKAIGFVPSLYGVLAESPAMLEAFGTVGESLRRTWITPS